MDKRFLLAIALSLLVLLTWSTFVSKTQYLANKEVTSKESPAISLPVQPATPSLPKLEPPPASLLQFIQEKFEITFIEPMAAVKEVTFKAHQNYKFPLQYGFLLADPGLTFKKEKSSPDAITFVHTDQSKKIEKKFIFSNSNYSMWLELKLQNLSTLPLKINLPVILGVLDYSASNIQARYQDIAVLTKDKMLHLAARKNLEFKEVKFLSLRDRYFCSIIAPEPDNYTGYVRKISPQESEVSLASPEFLLMPGQYLEQKFHIYLGPQELGLINNINPEWSQVINYGTFDFISQILLQLLRFLYRIVHNWGGAIVLLSLLVYLLLYPLTLKQMRSMKEMQALQPHIAELRKTYKDNPQKLNKEIMGLYRQHKVNPLGGCLPLLLQMPIFFALYQALMRSVALKGANFLWIKDLSEPDRLFILPVSLPILGNEINILPLLMTLGMFIQQKISTVATPSAANEQQKMMLVIFPLMFGLIFYHMPAGLVLYWFINSSLTLLYQFRITRTK